MPDSSKSSASLSKHDYETLATIRYTLRQFLRFSEEAAQSVGLTPQQHQALLAIMGFPGRDRLTIGELAERLQIRHHSAVGLVNRLHATGLIVREQDENDRRQVYVSLTPRGQEVLQELTAAHKRELRVIAREMTRLLETISTED